jgi:hypothetical protein
MVPGMILVDGLVAGTWKIERSRRCAVLHVSPFAPLPESDRTALSEDGDRLMAFAAPDNEQHEVRFARSA